MVIRGAVAAFAAFGALAVLMLASAGGAGAAREGGGGCANTTQPSTEVPVGALKKAIECLIDEERASRGRATLDRNRKLAEVAGKHVKKMVQTNCLDHVCGGEAPVDKRIVKSGYLGNARSFDFGENVGCEHSAQSMIERWMNSSFHRSNILERKFDDIALAADHGRVPSECAEGYSTFVVIFGHRIG